MDLLPPVHTPTRTERTTYPSPLAVQCRAMNVLLSRIWCHPIFFQIGSNPIFFKYLKIKKYFSNDHSLKLLYTIWKGLGFVLNFTISFRFIICSQRRCFTFQDLFTYTCKQIYGPLLEIFHEHLKRIIVYFIYYIITNSCPLITLFRSCTLPYLEAGNRRRFWEDLKIKLLFL